MQVEASVRTYGANAPLHRHLRRRRLPGQVAALRRGPEIVVATPGRLLDHARQRTIDLSSVEILVLDEADRMLDMGFIRDIRSTRPAAGSTPEPPLQRDLLERDPQPGGGPAGPTGIGPGHPAQYADRARAPGRAPGGPRAQARAPVAPGAHQGGRPGTRLHPHQAWCEQAGRAAVAGRHRDRRNPRQQVAAQRVRALNDFKAGRVTLLIATEVAARGLDIEQLPHVVNYELPMVPSDYVHRIGRTGRAGTQGDAISLVCIDEMPLLRDIERLLGAPIPSETVAGFELTAPFAPSRFGCAPVVGSAASAGAAGPSSSAGRRGPAAPTAASAAREGRSPSATGTPVTDHWTSLPGERKRR